MKWRTVLFVLIAGLAAAAAPAQTPMETTAQPLTISGTVVSTSGSQLVLDTDSGRKTFIIDADSASLPVGITVGSRVSVGYHDMAGQMHLANASILDTSTSPTNLTPVEPAEPALPRVSEPVEPTQAAPATTPPMEPAATDTDTADRTLPRTASPVPLAGLIGALALAGGLALRFRR